MKRIFRFLERLFEKSSNKRPEVIDYCPEQKMSERWSWSELRVALYARVFDVEDLGLTEEYIAQCIGRTEGALKRKGYRTIKRVREGGGSEKIKEILDLFARSSRGAIHNQMATLVFWESLEYAVQMNFVNDEVVEYVKKKRTDHLDKYFGAMAI